MGVGSRILHTAAEYEENLTAGHMWMTLLEGRHVSTDVAVVAGEPRWWRHVTGAPSGEGTFDYWAVQAASEPEIERPGRLIRHHLEASPASSRDHRRAHHRGASAPSDQWPGFPAALRCGGRPLSSASGRLRIRAGRELIKRVALARTVRATATRRRGRRGAADARRRRPDHHDKAPAQHAMPPGGFRLAIVNAWFRKPALRVANGCARISLPLRRDVCWWPCGLPACRRDPSHPI